MAGREAHFPRRWKHHRRRRPNCEGDDKRAPNAGERRNCLTGLQLREGGKQGRKRHFLGFSDGSLNFISVQNPGKGTGNNIGDLSGAELAIQAGHSSSDITAAGT